MVRCRNISLRLNSGRYQTRPNDWHTSLQLQCQARLIYLTVGHSFCTNYRIDVSNHACNSAIKRAQLLSVTYAITVTYRRTGQSGGEDWYRIAEIFPRCHAAASDKPLRLDELCYQTGRAVCEVQRNTTSIVNADLAVSATKRSLCGGWVGKIWLNQRVDNARCASICGIYVHLARVSSRSFWHANAFCLYLVVFFSRKLPVDRFIKASFFMR
jgi:hypothetical protein